MTANGKWNRRTALRAAAALTGAAAAAPLLGTPAAAVAGGDADALFKAGEFERAGRAYEELLRKDPTNAHAAQRRGLVGLLGNTFADAESYLGMALELAPGDQQTNRLLADCYVRQDKLSLSAPHWRAAGLEAWATWFGAVSGQPYELHGDQAAVPWLQMDPNPLVEASVNGGPAKRFMFYTGAPYLGVSATVAREAGLTAVAKQRIDYLGGVIWSYYGVLDSFRLGGIELRNVPVEWSETEAGEDVDKGHDGLIGMWIFYHLLTTFDYANRALVLRRRTPEAARNARAGTTSLPMWLVREHMLHSRGSINGSGQRVMGVNFGGIGEIATGMPLEVAERFGVRIDRDRPLETFAHSQPVVVYPCYPKEVRIGPAAARDIYSNANPDRRLDAFGFDVYGHFAHTFWKPYTVTLDFTDMKLCIG